MPRKRIEQIKEYKKKSGQTAFEFNVYVGKDPITKKTVRFMRRGFNSYVEAARAYNDVLAKINNGELLKERVAEYEAMTVHELFNYWLQNNYRTSGVQESTIATTNDIFNNHILNEFGETDISQLTVPMLQSWVDRISPILVNFKPVVNYFNRLLKYAVTMEFMAKNPFDHVVVPNRGKNSTKPDNNFFSTPELNTFIGYLEQHTNASEDSGKVPYMKYAFFRLLAYSGMRKGEALALKWTDLDFKNHKVNIVRTLATDRHGTYTDSQPPKWGSIRKISLDNKTLEILQSWRTLQKNEFTQRALQSELVFMNRYGKWIKLVQPNKWLSALLKLINDDYKKAFDLTHDSKFDFQLHRITPHGFRHTHATWLFENNPRLTPKAVQVRLGHKTIAETLEIYNHVTNEQRDAILDTLNRQT
ncbi:site-specific integrase [Lactobacillus sp. CC-MHH1034]|uniref:tyrosine-type recombinase/integrase n=1 Tax=Agrilactobacillus fermenti TaxID=2586909 RepID=UPI001E49F0C2|nr:site-specific integrase [Agrilactobacillus fermenti]MCD2257382.1 site-specific integrase [Agrilactobacillus fermenti]